MGKRERAAGLIGKSVAFTRPMWGAGAQYKKGHVGRVSSVWKGKFQVAVGEDRVEASRADFEIVA